MEYEKQDIPFMQAQVAEMKRMLEVVGARSVTTRFALSHRIKFMEEEIERLNNSLLSKDIL